MATFLITADKKEVTPRDLNVFSVFRQLHSLDLDHCIEYSRRRPQGGIIVKMKPGYSDEQSRIHSLTEICQVPVKLSMPPHLNVIRGVVTHPELAHIDEEDLQALLTDQAITYWSKKATSDTAIIGWSLTSHTTPPPVLKLGWDTVRVRPYVPRPRRCYRCQEYGHVAEQCTSELTCARCAETHKTEDCHNAETYCYSCQKYGHAASSSDCPEWKKECAVYKIKSTGRLTYSEAVKEYKIRQEKKEDRKEDKKKEQEVEEDKKEEQEAEEDKKEEQEEEDKTIQQERKRPAEEDEQEQKTEDQKRKTEAEEWKTASSKRKQKKKKTDEPPVTCLLKESAFIHLYSHLPS